MENTKFTMSIDCGNAAFDDDSRGETVRLLRQVADNLENYGAETGTLHDINGHRAGSFEYVEDDTPDVDYDKCRTLPGTYGSWKTPCTVYAYDAEYGAKWYAVKGSVNVNLTSDTLDHGVDVEMLDDEDCFTAGSPINSVEDLARAVES